MEGRVTPVKLETPELETAMDRNNELLERLLVQGRDWKLALRNGLVAGVGGVLGATLVISLLLSVLKPFKSVAPWLDRITEAIERPRR